MCGNNELGQLGDGTFNNSNLFIPTTFVGKAKSTNRPYLNVPNNIDNYIQIQDTSDVYTYFPDMISRELLTVDISYSTIFDEYLKPDNRITISLEPANTVFTDYVYFDVPVTSFDNLGIYFKSEIDNNPIKLNTSDNGYGAYYEIIGSFVRIYTKHFSEVGIGNNEPIPCLEKSTEVLTPSGYVKVSKLRTGDLIITSDNRHVPIMNIFRTYTKGSDKTYPYIIEKSSIAPNYPPQKCKISGGHLIKYKYKWIHPIYSNKFKQDKTEDIITYYHIETPSYATDDLVINGGLIVETYGGTDKNNAKIWKNRVLRYFKNFKLENKKKEYIKKITKLK